ncbi:hypothetical protein [Flavobacterium wongokense]|uniref:hypothetical protein n=1 Tax=Flavobacterium wongokense TaxID=2910674 RepID=UPI001F2494EC|nr:hypothetical protein [Flavobacterium sp. WG47]MCF6133530.1 hypothetical protein [Flavobacterium sp. WG47]
MKRQLQFTFLYILVVILFSSCELVKGIFEAGMGFGIFIVVAVIALIIFILSKIGGKK